MIRSPTPVTAPDVAIGAAMKRPRETASTHGRVTPKAVHILASLPLGAERSSLSETAPWATMQKRGVGYVGSVLALGVTQLQVRGTAPVSDHYLGTTGPGGARRGALLAALSRTLVDGGEMLVDLRASGSGAAGDQSCSVRVAPGPLRGTCCRRAERSQACRSACKRKPLASSVARAAPRAPSPDRGDEEWLAADQASIAVPANRSVRKGATFV